ncbi:fibrocystin-L-like [Portunus trituberculatus]|uniref:fibrocystin-L-like n=1 Tax=Portunus trituberculatus TaxID=210409 RepID=UPI001E1D0835|nr:fibrocystin-L-like [Portunus trituberculatus]
MKCLALVVSVAALVVGVASEATVTSRTPYWLGDAGGVVLYIYGADFSEDEFSQFDPSLGNRVTLVNEEDEIECKVITYLSTTNKITCSTGPRLKPAASRVYNIVVYVDGVLAAGSNQQEVQYGHWVAPKVQRVTPSWSLPGALVELSGYFHTNKYYKVDYGDPLEEDPNSGTVITKAFVGGVPCIFKDENEELLGTVNSNKLTCRPEAQLVGPMNGSVFVTYRGASVTDQYGKMIDRHDRLFQYHTYAGVNSVSPAGGSTAGGTLLTIEGVGFDPYMEKTKVEVGGVECAVQEISDTQIKCLTPAQDDTFAGSGERGVLMEVYEGEYFETNFNDEQSWAALTPSHAGYRSFVSEEPMLLFPVEINQDSVGTIKGYFHASHDGLYAFGYAAGDRTVMFMAVDGNPDNMVAHQHGMEYAFTQDTRHTSRSASVLEVMFIVVDINSKFVASQTWMAGNERHRVRMDIKEVFEKQSIVIQRAEGDTEPVIGSLFMNGISSAPVDVSDSALVREQLLDMTEQKCEMDLSAVDSRHYHTFEDGTKPPGCLGDFVGKEMPYCGRKMYKLRRTDPRIYRETNENLMVNANIHKYLCFAVSGNLESSMAINFRWADNQGGPETIPSGLSVPSPPADTLSFSLSWTYTCVDLIEVMVNSWGGSQYNVGDKLLVKNIVLPKPVGPTDDVFVDEVVFLSVQMSVTLTRPSALKLQGILVDDVVVEESETDESYSLKFVTTNCMGGMPLLAVFEGEADNNLIETLATAQTYDFTIGTTTVTTNRDAVATNPLAGTWDLTVQGQTISDIPADIHPSTLDSFLESALETKFSVSESGSCRNHYYKIEWQEDPGRKELMVLDGSSLVFDGEEVETVVTRDSEGKVVHNPLAADFVTTHRASPHVRLEVNGYFGACLGDCSFTYDDSTTPTLTAVSGTPGEGQQHSLTLTGTGFTSSSLGDYSVSVGPWSCTPTAVTTTELTCTVEVWGGLHTVTLTMQPAGTALTTSPVTYQVPVTVTSLSITEGGTGGQYPILITGTGFPNSAGWDAGSATVTMGGNDCVVISGSPTEVTCTVPAGDGVVDVVVDVGGTTGSLPSSFTYDPSLSPTITTLSLTVFSLFGQEELVITGTNFGSSGSVNIGSGSCEVTEWAETSVTCLTPSLAAGTYTLTLFADGFGAALSEAVYEMQVTSASAMQGSVKGGTLVKLGGTGFGSDCSRVTVKLGDLYHCEVLQCSNEAITCLTKPAVTNHKIVNVGGNSEDSVVWAPKLLNIMEGDTVTWQWNKLSDNSQVRYGVCEVPSPVDGCEDADGSGFYSGAQTLAGSFSVSFPQEGTYHYAGPEIVGGLVMRGRINVVRPAHQVLKVAVMLGEQEATYQVEGSEAVTVSGCNPILETPLDGCDLPDLTIPDDGNLYFQFHTCYTPVVTSLASSTTHTVDGLSALEMLGGDSLTITGSGFGDADCQVEVSIGDASCTVTSASDTSVTCDLDDLENLRSGAYLPVTVKAINRGVAVTNIADYKNEGRVVVVPEVTALNPTEGSLGGGTLVTISGTGLQGVAASTVVGLGGKACVVQEVSSTTVTCLTPPSDSATTVSLTLAVAGVPAKMDALTFTYSEARTPVVSSMAVEGEVVTLSGQNFGSDGSQITITLVAQTDSRSSSSLDTQDLQGFRVLEEEEEEEEAMKEMLDDDIDFFVDDELEQLARGDLAHTEAHDAVRGEKSRRRLRRRPRLILQDMLDAPEGFWGTFTGTGAATFKDTLRLGAWRMAGTAPLPRTKDHHTREAPAHQRQSDPATYSCTVTNLTPTEATCTVDGLPAGSYSAEVNVAGAGDALADGVTSDAVPVVASITPESGSTNGGAVLVVDGSGFIAGSTAVTVGGADCTLLTENANQISCRVPAGAAGAVAVVVSVAGSDDVTAATSFTYDAALTPTLESVTPSTDVTGGATLTLAGTGFTLSGSDPEVLIGGESCVVSSPATATSLQCTAPTLAGGSHEVVVRDTMYGDSNTLTISFAFSLASVTPSVGSFSGAEVTLAGQGFDPAGSSTVTFCDLPCEPVTIDGTTSLTCVAPAQPASESDVACDVVVSNPDGSTASLVGGFTYQVALTPIVTNVSPQRGGTAGGTTLTITGTGFESSGNTVTIGGSECVVSSQGPESITCVTEAHQGPGQFPVQVTVPGKGLATTDENGIFFYIDLWSSPFTWDNQPPPSEGQLAVVTEGQTLLLDQSTPVLKMLLIQGGHVVFDVEAVEELVLRAEYILIVEGGSLSIGSEEEAFPGDAVIELYGNTQSIELPMYGAKVLAVRDGTLDLHGKHVPITWTHLAQTAEAGETTITLVLPVTWKQGDQIVIATTEKRFSINENEVRTIASVSEDGLEVTLTEALEHTHISLIQTLGGRTVETRAEVGLLTRNIKIRGNINADFTENIEGCGETWTPDQFDTQTCFNGRFGDEIGSDQFGATVMLFGKYPDQDLVTGHIEYVEVTEAGQAFQLGRYPLHFHMVGDVTGSYIRGCAVHRTYNRAVTIHGANNLVVERNVAYNNMGHAIFTEDGVEQNNVVEYNLAVFTRTSSSLLNVDVTPSSFWVVNPNNIFRHNAAAGGTHFGYWYRLERHPSGPSATNSYCQNNEQMGQFFNNTAHSMGRYGLWVFSMDGYFPKSRNCGGSDQVAKWESFTVWHCDRGAEVVLGGALQFHDFVALDNEHAGLEMVKMLGGFGEDDGPGIFNSLVVGHSALSSGSCSDEASGIIAPKQYLFSISDVTFVNFDTGTCSALSGCSQCKVFQGGFQVQVKGLSFDNSPNKLRFLWEHETIWIDADSSLTGTTEAVVVPDMGILPPSSCTADSAFAVNPEFPGVVCTGLKFARFNIKGPDTEPTSLQARDLIVTNEHGTTNVPYRVKRLTTEGWMGIVYTGATYDWTFDEAEQITNITYVADTRHLAAGDHYFVRHTFLQTPDGFGTTSDERESLDALPDPATNVHGDFYWEDSTKQLTYLVSHTEASERHLRTVFDDRVEGDKRNIDFRVYRCQYEGCIPPTPPPVPTGRPDVSFRWSDVETWKEVPVGSGGHPTENEYNLPVEGDEIIIPKGMWLIVDTATPKLARVYVYGTIEFDDTMDHDFEATIIYIQGGSVVAGFSSDAPFTHNLNIRLRGSLDPTDPDNEDMPMPPGVPNVGWKAMGVFGYLKLHGQVSGSSWLKLGATAESGSTTVTLAEAPDASWLNKQVVVTATGKEATESEVRLVTDITGSTLTLDSPLNFQHLGDTHTLSDGSSITLAGEVGLLTRNIVVEGNTYEGFEDDSFGGRVLVSKLTHDGVDYVGTAQIDGVEFRNMGQESFTDLDDPRYSLAFVGLDAIEEDSSYVKRSSFNLNYNVALGLIGTSGMVVDDNVIYFALDSGVRDETGFNTYTNNLITTVLFLGTYGDREETQNLNVYGAFQIDNAPNLALVGNVVAGAEQAGFKTFGEMCEDATQWMDNEVHSALFGVMAWRKGSMGPVTECRRINNFYAWRVSDTAFYVQHYANSFITNILSVDNALGVNQLIYSPAALTHEYHPKTATISISRFVSSSPSHSCTYQESQSEIMNFYGDKLWDGGVDGGNTALLFGTFMSGINMAPKHAFYPTDTYPALYGSTHIQDTTFYNFADTSCGRDIALMANPRSDDAIHPIFVNGLTFHDTPEDNYLFIPRPNVGRVNPSDCVDMDCDGHRKVVCTDEDGSLLGGSGGTVISQADWEWDGDERRGIGDYRIPVSLRQNADGTEIEASQKFPNKGIARDESCSVASAWQAWKCTSLSHRMMILESMDTDTEVRRLSPIALIANPGLSGYVDLLNGPMDRGWCFGYTCQERISTFYAIVSSQEVYEIGMTSTPPQVLRLHLLHGSPSEAVIVRIFFPKPQRYDIYVDDVFVPPTNLDTSASGYQLLPEDSSNLEEFFPTLDDAVGTNYFQRSAKLVHVVLRSGHVVDIKTTPMITLSSGLVVTDDEFFEENLVSNLADLFGVSEENIRLTNVVREDSRRQESGTVEVEATGEVASAPTTSLSGEGGEGAVGGEVISYEELIKDLEAAINKFQEGSCTSCLSLAVNDPVEPPPKEIPPKATEEEGSVVGEELFSDKQQQEEAEELEESLKTTEYAQPSDIQLVQGLSDSVVQNAVFAMQPIVTVLDEEGEVVNDLGHSSDPWLVTAQLCGGPEGAELKGTLSVPYVDGAATFTNLLVTEPGDGYSLSFTITHPADAPDLSVAMEDTFSVEAMTPAITVLHPEYLIQGQSIASSVQFVDLDTQQLLDPDLFASQTIVGEVLARTLGGEYQLIKRLYWADGALSELSLDDIVVEESSVRYELLVKVAVVPNGWYLEYATPIMVVYPEHLVEVEDTVEKELGTLIYRFRNQEDVEVKIEDEMFNILMDSVDMMADGVRFGRPTVIFSRKNRSSRNRVKGESTFMITGPEAEVDEAILKTCQLLRRPIPMDIMYECRAWRYGMKKLLVDGKYVRCRSKIKG